MIWTLAILGAALVALLYLAYSYDYRQIRARSRRHREAGGKPSDAPDWTPGHGGGASGG